MRRIEDLLRPEQRREFARADIRDVVGVQGGYVDVLRCAARHLKLANVGTVEASDADQRFALQHQKPLQLAAMKVIAARDPRLGCGNKTLSAMQRLDGLEQAAARIAAHREIHRKRLRVQISAVAVKQVEIERGRKLGNQLLAVLLGHVAQLGEHLGDADFTTVNPHIAAGRAVLEKELQREGKSSLKHDDIAQALDFERAEDLYAALGREEIGKGQLHQAISGETQAELAAPPRAHPLKPEKAAQGNILVVGVDRLMTQLARCCKPAPPDAIAGFVTRGRGISVHRAGCPSLAHLATRNPERLLPAAWAPRLGADSAFQVDIVVRASDRNGLLSDIMEVLAREKIRVTGSQSYRRDDAATHFLTVNVASLDDLKRTLAQVGAVRGVASVARR